MSSQSLAARVGPNREVLILLATSSLLLVAGYVLPVMAVEKFALWQSDYSLWGGVWEIFKGGDYLIATVIFLFSIVFPSAKLLLLSIVWFVPLQASRQGLALRWMHHLGRWSMLDVFVVAILLVMSRANFVATVHPRIGLFLFAGAIVFSMVLTLRIDQLKTRIEGGESTEDLERLSNPSA